ncbi:hypothetical protein D3C80_868610 [compost metagenome]
MYACILDAGFFRAIDHCIDQRLGPAHVDVGIVGHVGEQPGEVQATFQAVDINAHVRCMRAVGQLALERTVFGAAEGVVQLIGHCFTFQLVKLGKERGDTDTAGDQHMATSLGIEGKQIVRGGDGQCTADLHLLVHERRAALGLLFQTHTDLVMAQVAWVAHQRVGVAELLPVGALHLHDHMAATGECRHRLAILAHEGEALDLRGRLLYCGNPHAEHLVCVGHNSPQLQHGAAAAAPPR